MQANYQTDVLVIGGGGAAARAAIEAADMGADVIMVMKKTYLHSGATAYQVSEMAGFNVGDGAADRTDSPDGHYEDIMYAADGVAIPELAKNVAYEAADTLQTLRDWGVPFEMDGDDFLAFKSCFSRKARTHVIKGHGEPILSAMKGQLDNRKITILENTMVISLLMNAGGECVGAVIADDRNELRWISAKATILAAGGAGQVFEKNLNPPDVTGDGYALAFRSGAQLVNMEFMQAGIGLSYPITSLLNAYIWSGHPVLTNADGEAFLQDDLPEGISEADVMDAHAHHFPFSCSDCSYLLETAVQKQIQEGKGTRENGVYMDLTHMTDEYVRSVEEDSGLKKMWPIARDYYESQNVHVTSEPVQIACFAHAINGGILIDEHGRSSVSGLYAAGETAGGPHGADRLGGNMLLTCQIYGARAGKAAAEHTKALKEWDGSPARLSETMADAMSLLHKNISNHELQGRLKKLTQRYLLVRRNEEGLRELLDGIADMEQAIECAGAADTPDTATVETSNMLFSAKLMAMAALNRRESRGAHYRSDYPQKNDGEYRMPFVQQFIDGQIASRPLQGGNAQ